MMFRVKAQSANALAVYGLLEGLQQYFVQQLDTVVCWQNKASSFQTVEWFRNQGRQGGGVRYVANNKRVFNRACINISQVHYDAMPHKKFSSASALSAIIHPLNPYAPSIHVHISWSEIRGGKGYWRMMADLNPAIKNEQATKTFSDCLKQTVPKQYQAGLAQGKRYFYIPALQRHRGVVHFYLENYNSGDLHIDFNLANALGRSVITTYVQLFCQSIDQHPKPTDVDYQQQLAYHTLYLLQVLTLDKGTITGLLAHNQNDLGIMGSLPAQIDKTLLTAWLKQPTPQQPLLSALIQALPNKSPCYIDDTVKLVLANVIRQHYANNPEALVSMQSLQDN